MSGWDKLLAAPAAGPLCALLAWRLTPWIARARLAWITRLRGRPLTPGEHANWQVWAAAGREQGRTWRTFLVEPRALVRELDELVALIPTVRAPVITCHGEPLARWPARSLRSWPRSIPLAAPNVTASAAFARNFMRMIKTPVRSPRANSCTERFVGTLRPECLGYVRHRLGHAFA